MNNKQFYIKLIVSMVASFLISQILINEVFIAKSSRIRPRLDQYLFSKVSNGAKTIASLGSAFTIKNPFNWKTSQTSMPIQTGNQSGQFFDQINPNDSPKNLLKDIPLNNVAKGIYRKENAHVNYLLIKEKDVDWINYELESNGKKISVQMPRGDEQPTQGLFDTQ